MALLSPSSLGKYRRERPDNYHMWLCFLGWLALFGVGITAPSEPFRTVLVNILVETKTAAGFRSMPTTEPSTGPAPAAAPAIRRAVLQPQPSPPPMSANPFQDPAPLEPALAAPISGWSWPMRLAMIAPLVLATFITFTPTNLLLLCCFGAALGSYAVRLIPHTFESDEAKAGREPPGVPAVIAMLHGLIVFAAAVAGLIVVQGDFKWDETRGDLYLRLASTVTIFSIAAGTNRHFVRDLAQAFMPFRGGFGTRGPSPAPGPQALPGPGPGPGGAGPGGGGAGPGPAPVPVG